jgi:hypothetical protein
VFCERGSGEGRRAPGVWVRDAAELKKHEYKRLSRGAQSSNAKVKRRLTGLMFEDVVVQVTVCKG